MEILEFYKCNICGNLVQALVNGGGELVCCGKPMEKLESQNNEEAVMEKHIPVFIKEDNQYEIRIGEVLHPMLEEHHIMFIQAVSEDKNNIQLKILHAGDEPKMRLNEKPEKVTAYEYCNIHGLWEGKNA